MLNTYLKYLAVSFGLGILFTIAAAFSKQAPSGILPYLYYIVAVPLFIGSGAFLGRLFRDFTKPDFFVTSGAVDTFKTKIFWKVGPHAIGAFLGLMATEGLYNNLFKKGPAMPEVAAASAPSQASEQPAMSATVPAPEAQVQGPVATAVAQPEPYSILVDPGPASEAIPVLGKSGPFNVYDIEPRDDLDALKYFSGNTVYQPDELAKLLPHIDKAAAEHYGLKCEYLCADAQGSIVGVARVINPGRPDQPVR